MKKAFSLIEVVFAIVIVAISLMSVPMLLKQSSKANENSIIQESILAASTQMGNILSYAWDGASYDANNTILRVLDVTAGDNELARDMFSLDKNYRKDCVIGDKRRRFFDTATYTKVYPKGGGISQFNGTSTTITGKGAYDYKDSSISMNSKVFYISDSADYSKKNITFTVSTIPVANSTNIKMIELNTTSPLLGKSFILRTYSCNIGQSGLLHRYYP